MAAQQQFSAFLGSKEDTTGQFILLSDSESTGGGFMTHYYIQRSIRAGHKTCVISLLHTFNHYSSICNKLGVSLSKAMDEGSLQFMDCLSGTTIATDQVTETTNQIFQSPYSPQDLNIAIIKAIDAICGRGLPMCVIMDDVNILLSLGWSVEGVVKMVTDIYDHVLEITNDIGYVVVASHDINDQDDEEVDRVNDHTLHLHLLHRCTLALKMSGLATGYSKDVHGEVTRYSRDPFGSFPLNYKSRAHSSQYRILDRGIRLFAKGTSVAVL